MVFDINSVDLYNTEYILIFDLSNGKKKKIKNINRVNIDTDVPPRLVL